MSNKFKIGVCSWSIDRHNVLRGIEVAGRELGLRVAQLGFFGEESVNRADAGAISATAREFGVTLVGSFVAFDGEDYSSIQRIAATGGYASDSDYAARLELTRRAAILTVEIGCSKLAVHAATIPDNASSPVYAKLVERVREAADVLSEVGVHLLLETGRESAAVLNGFIEAVSRGNVAVNYDPANFVVYGTDEPVSAIKALQGRIMAVHIKDATRAAQPGVEYGRAALLGSGDVEVAHVVSRLRAVGYKGPLLIETGSAHSGREAISGAAEYLRSVVE